MMKHLDTLLQVGCDTPVTDKVCRSRGGESCAFDGAMIVLQPIADAAHLVHGPIACCGNSWEGRGALSSRGTFHNDGFTTDMAEMDIIYGGERKLSDAIRETHRGIRPAAIFVYATCVSGLIGEDIDAVCRHAEAELGIPVIPVNAPGFVGPKNLGNRIAGDVLLDRVIGTGRAPHTTDGDINLIGEYNIAGDLWHVEPLLAAAGLRVLSRMTGDAAFEEITWAHEAKLNVVVCSRALINIAKEMQRRYGIPYVEVSFFGRTETSRALRLIAGSLFAEGDERRSAVEELIGRRERDLADRLIPYAHLKGKRAVLYTGGVKSWSFISALHDLGMEIVAVGTKKSTFEDEQKMREIMGPDAPLEEDVTPANILRLLKERAADVLVAGGRNKYLAAKEGYPFIDVNQERHSAYAGYDGLVTIAADLSNSIRFYERHLGQSVRSRSAVRRRPVIAAKRSDLVMNPLRHSAALGAAVALQGFDRSLPLLHGAQGCTFLGKVLMTNHYQDPIALLSSRLFTEDVVMGSEERLMAAAREAIRKNKPDILGILTTGLSEAKGDDINFAAATLRGEFPGTLIVHVPTPDYEDGFEKGYVNSVIALLHALGLPGLLRVRHNAGGCPSVVVFAGSHLSPADMYEIRLMIESFGLRSVFVPDLAALDGSRRGLSAVALGGTTIDDLMGISSALSAVVIGASLMPAGDLLHDSCGIEYRSFHGLSDIEEVDAFLDHLSLLSGRPIPGHLSRQRAVLVDGMRDAHACFGGKVITLGLNQDHAVAVSRCVADMGAVVGRAVVPEMAGALDDVEAEEVVIGDMRSLRLDADLLITGSHGVRLARRSGTPHLELGFPAHHRAGAAVRVSVGYRGILSFVHEMAALMTAGH